MWENPYYHFKIFQMNDEGLEELVTINIDVTKSAWAKEISPDCKKVLNILIGKGSEYKINSILDFGCGKFTTVNYILGKNKEITLVDFEILLNRYEFMKKKYEKLKESHLFSALNFPYPFLNDKNKYDLVLLIHVIPVMPIFLERLILLSILHEKVKKDKYLFFYGLKNLSNYRKREKENNALLGDGLWMGKNNSDFKTFFKYHEPNYLVFIMWLCGWENIREFKVPSIDSFLFKRNDINLFADLLNNINYQKIIPFKMEIQNDGKIIPIGKDSEFQINPFPEDFEILNLVKLLLENIEPGIKKPFPTYFKLLCAGIIQYLFSEQLTNMQIEEGMNDRSDIVDTTFQTTGKTGFFKYLSNSLKINCSILFIEIKNYNIPLSNEEFQQLYDRFDEKVGEFGFLICRKDANSESYRNQVIKRINKGKGYCIVLDDKSLIKALKIRIEDGIEGVNKFFMGKIKKLLLK